MVVFRLRYVSSFQKWALLTTIATYGVITAGGLVRVAGAGLGCPDWPQCFGRYYPPLTESQVPDEFAGQFNFQLAWIEYTNRIVGVLVGLLIIGTLYHALKSHRQNPRILYPSIGAFITILVQGWLGGQVVEEKLDPTILTAHLVLALVVVSLLLYATISGFYPDTRPFDNLPTSRRTLGKITLVVLILSLPQIAFGAFLRGELHDIEKANPTLGRSDFIREAGWVDIVHRSYSWLVLFGVLYLFYYLYKHTDRHPWLLRNIQATGILLGIQVGAGIAMVYGGIPPVFQAIHLVNGSLFLGSLTTLYLLASRIPEHIDISESDPKKNIGLSPNREEKLAPSPSAKIS